MDIHKPFKVTISPNITRDQIPTYYRDSPAWIDSNWFKQIEMTQHNRGSAEQYTELEVNFSVPESEWEIHDCFVPGFMAIINQLEMKSGKKYTVNSTHHVVSGKHVLTGKVVKASVQIVNNKIIE